MRGRRTSVVQAPIEELKELENRRRHSLAKSRSSLSDLSESLASLPDTQSNASREKELETVASRAALAILQTEKSDVVERLTRVMEAEFRKCERILLAGTDGVKQEVIGLSDRLRDVTKFNRRLSNSLIAEKNRASSCSAQPLVPTSKKAFLSQSPSRLEPMPEQIGLGSDTVGVDESASQVEPYCSPETSHNLRTFAADSGGSCVGSMVDSQIGSAVASSLGSATSCNSRRKKRFASGAFEEEANSWQQKRSGSGTGNFDIVQEFTPTFATDVNKSESQQSANGLRRRRHAAIQIWAFLEDPHLFRWGSTYLNMMVGAILLSAMLPILQTTEVPLLDPVPYGIFEICLEGLFTVEVILRLCSTPSLRTFCFNPYNIVDMAAVVVPLFVKSGAGFFLDVKRAEANGDYLVMAFVTMIPVVRMLKLLRRSDTSHLIMKAVNEALAALPILLYNLSVIVLFFASMLYLSESREDIPSLATALWCCVVTVGTVGYGDVVPKSTPGTVVIASLIVLSALYMAIPIGIVGSAFQSVWERRDQLLLVHRTATRFQASGYTVRDIPRMFLAFDDNNDGVLSLNEFTELMRHLEIAFDKDRITDVFQHFDENNDGVLDDKEFVKALFPWAFAEMYGDLADDAEEALTEDQTESTQETYVVT